jgi:hypothetical protein
MNICKEEDCFYNQNGKCTNIQEPIGTTLNKAIKPFEEIEYFKTFKLMQPQAAAFVSDTLKKIPTFEGENNYYNIYNLDKKVYGWVHVNSLCVEVDESENK